jgi:hypothetical protein
VIVLRFRHDKVMDVLMKPAFEADKALQIELIDDPRFRGVYLLFAQAADRDTARRLRDLLVSRGARNRRQWIEQRVCPTVRSGGAGLRC